MRLRPARGPRGPRPGGRGAAALARSSARPSAADEELSTFTAAGESRRYRRPSRRTRTRSARSAVRARPSSKEEGDALEVLSLPWSRRADRARSSASPCGCAQERAPINRVQADGAVEALLRRRQPERPVRRPGILHGRPDHRRALRRRPGLLALPVDRVARAHQVGDPGDGPHRPPHLRAHPEQRLPRLADRPTTGRSSPSSTSRATSTSSATTTRRPASSSTSSSRTRPIALVRARVLSRRLVDEPGHRRLRLRLVRGRHRAATASSSIRSRTTTRTRATRTRPSTSEADGYLDITTKVFATPADRHDALRPARALRGLRRTSPAVTCNPAEVTVRLSFKKVVDDDFEPEDWDGNKMNAFGWFTDDRFGYDRNYGIVDQDWHRFATKYNIWQQSHVPGTQCAIDEWRDASGNVQNYQVDGAGNYVLDPTTGLPIPDPERAAVHDERRRAGRAPRHRQRRHRRRVRVQGRQRQRRRTPGRAATSSRTSATSRSTTGTTKTTPLYYGPTSAPDLFATHRPGAQRMEHRGQARGAARQGGRGEPRRRRRRADGAELPDERGRPHRGPGERHGPVPDIFVLCHNPVIAGDSAGVRRARAWRSASATSATTSVNIIPDPQLPSAWGVDDRLQRSAHRREGAGEHQRVGRPCSTSRRSPSRT